MFARGIPVTGAAGRSSPVLAEHCIYFMLQSCYHTKELLAAQAKCQWGVAGMNNWRGLYGRTAGILGMGHNGRMLADRLHAFGMKVIAYDKFLIQGFDYLDCKLCANDGDKAEGGWDRLMKADLTPDQVNLPQLEKYLGKRDWTDPSEWM